MAGATHPDPWLRLRALAVFLLLALPWLNPFSPGPTPSVMPWLFSMACGALALPLANRLDWPRLAMQAWLAAALVSAVLGLLQYFGATALFGVWVNHTDVGEAFANLRQRNQFATLTSIGLAALLWQAARANRAGTQNGAGYLMLLSGAALLAAGNAASTSRTGLMQLLLLVLLSAIWGHWRETNLRRVMLVAVFSYALTMVALPWLAGLDPANHSALARLRAGDAPCASRIALWSNVLRLIGQKPWLGWGWGELSYAHFITLYPGVRFCAILDNAHNLPLHLAVELGLPAAVLICGAALVLCWRARPWTESDPTQQAAWAVLAVIGLHSLLEYPLWYGPFQIAFGLCIWMLWRLPAKRMQPDSAYAYSSFAFVGYSLTATVVIAVSTLAAWDYQRMSQVYLLPKMRLSAYRSDTLSKVQDVFFFQNQVRFAELTTTKLSAQNAAHLNDLARHLIHFSPEPRVIEKYIESAVMLGQEEDALHVLARYRMAFPEEHARWVKQ